MLLELSYTLHETIPTYPGSPSEYFTKNTRITDGDPSNTSVITHYIHNGSHVDAPFHFDKEGLTIDEIPIETFMFKNPVVIDCKKSKSELIEMQDLVPYENQIINADILFFNTYYALLRDNISLYVDDFPALSLEVATYIRNNLTNVKAVGIDTLSIESAIQGPTSNFAVHRMLLHKALSDARPLVVYEDINISLIQNRKINYVWAFPLRLKGLDGSPITMVAEVQNE